MITTNALICLCSPRRLPSLLMMPLLLLLLSACGGGGGGSGSGGNGNGGNNSGSDASGQLTEQPVSREIAASGQAVSIDARQLLPAGFAATAWQWRQSSGTDVAIADSSAAALDFEPPTVAVADTLQFELTATDAAGEQVLAPLALTLVNPAQALTDVPLAYRLERLSGEGSCRVPDIPTSNAAVVLTPVFAGISVKDVADMEQAPGDDKHWYFSQILSRKILRFNTDAEQPEAEVVLDLSAMRGKLRSMTFHPDFANNGKIYVQIHNGKLLESPTTIHEFTWSAALGGFDPDSARLILAVDSTHDNIEYGEHPGGNLNFGPDGYLYSALGDGTDPNHFGENSQLVDNLWGSLLRIDVDGGSPYAIPPDNPFANGGGRPEIFAWGFRHPWKWSFDRQTGDIWVADVGLVTREEINRVVLGGNYGWPIREGFQRCPNCQHDKMRAEVDPDTLLNPVIDYGRDLGRSVTGGYVYRGEAMAELQGSYIFADYLSGNVFAVRDGGAGSRTPEVLTQTSISIVTFAEDHQGEIYALDYENGGIYRIDANEPGLGDDFPRQLSATGCVDMADPEQLLPGMIPYTVQVPLWSDNAGKSRWMSLPAGAQISEIEGSSGDLDFPIGTVLVKHFTLDNRMIETRLFMRHADGQWAGYSYEWNDSGSEATLLEEGKDKNINGQSWHYPSGAECLQCHTRAAGWALGPTTRQLNTYQDDGEALYSQLRMLEALQLFDFAPDHSRQFAAPENTAAGLDDRARAYLDVNCSGCHRPGGEAGRSEMDLRADTPMAETGICDVVPLVDSLGIPQGRLLVPGDPENSVLHARIRVHDAYRMPPLSSNIVHPEGMALLEEWILAMDNCQ